MQEPQSPWNSLLGSDFSQDTFERYAALLGGSRLSQDMYAGQKAMIVQKLQRDYGNRYVQRLLNHISRSSSGGGDTLTDSPLVRKAEQENRRSDEYPVTPETAGQIDEARSTGRTFEPEVRREMESAFGKNFSQVRIHTEPGADRLNREVDAQAFTSANDVFFRKDSYYPESKAGKELIAHELTHVANQSQPGVKRNTDDGETISRVTVTEIDEEGEEGEELEQITGPEQLMIGLSQELQEKALSLPPEVMGMALALPREIQEEFLSLPPENLIQLLSLPVEKQTDLLRLIYIQEVLPESVAEGPVEPGAVVPMPSEAEAQMPQLSPEIAEMVRSAWMREMMGEQGPGLGPVAEGGGGGGSQGQGGQLALPAPPEAVEAPPQAPADLIGPLQAMSQNSPELAERVLNLRRMSGDERAAEIAALAPLLRPVLPQIEAPPDVAKPAAQQPVAAPPAVAKPAAQTPVVAPPGRRRRRAPSSDESGSEDVEQAVIPRRRRRRRAPSSDESGSEDVEQAVIPRRRRRRAPSSDESSSEDMEQAVIPRRRRRRAPSSDESSFDEPVVAPREQLERRGVLDWAEKVWDKVLSTVVDVLDFFNNVGIGAVGGTIGLIAEVGGAVAKTAALTAFGTAGAIIGIIFGAIGLAAGSVAAIHSFIKKRKLLEIADSLYQAGSNPEIVALADYAAEQKRKKMWGGTAVAVIGGTALAAGIITLAVPVVGPIIGGVLGVGAAIMGLGLVAGKWIRKRWKRRQQAGKVLEAIRDPGHDEHVSAVAMLGEIGLTTRQLGALSDKKAKSLIAKKIDDFNKSKRELMAEKLLAFLRLPDGDQDRIDAEEVALGLGLKPARLRAKSDEKSKKTIMGKLSSW